MTAPGEPRERQWTAGACAFVLIGVLILIPSGLCTGTFGYFTIVEMLQARDPLGALANGFFVLAISGSFLAGAIFLIVLGLRNRKTK